MSVVTARSARRSNERARFWERLVWALDELERVDRARYDIPWTVLRELQFVPWAGDDDLDLATKLSRGIEQARSTRPTDPQDDPEDIC
jgi:hypothetical protein